MSTFLNKPILKYFSVFPTYTNFSGGTNIYSLGGYSGTTQNTNISLESISYNCQYYVELLNAITRLSEYRNHEFSKTVLDLYRDSVLGSFSLDTDRYIEIEKDQEATDKINNLLVELNFSDLLNSSFKDMVYYGSYAHKLDRAEVKPTLKNFLFPFTTGYYKKNNEYLIQTNEGPKFIHDLIRFSLDDLSLIIDDTSLVSCGLLSHQDLNFKKGKDKVYANEKLICGEPLFLSAELKLKDYVLRDLISSFLSLIALIEQDTFTIEGQRSTDMDSLLNLCERIKGLIVTRDDMNLLASAKLNKEALIRRLFDRVRIIPSIGGAITSMGELRGSTLRDKLDAVNQSKEQVRDELLTSIGFPLDLFKGGTNRWEVTRQNDRFNLKIISLKNAVIKSIQSIVITLAKCYEIDIKGKRIHVICSNKTPYEISNIVQELNSQRDILNSVQEVLRTGSELSEIKGITNFESINDSINNILNRLNIKVDFKLGNSEGSTESETEGTGPDDFGASSSTGGNLGNYGNY